MKTTPLILMGPAILAMIAAMPRQEYPKLSPFEAVEWKGETVQVTLAGEDYRLQAIEGLPVEKILAFSKEKHPRKWQERFTEDLVQVLTEMGHRPKDRVSLDVISLKSGEAMRLDDVLMTHENRQRLLMANRSLGARLRRGGEDLKLSPFTGVRWPAEGVEVRIDGAWYRLVKLEGVPAEKLLALTKEQFGSRWQKRFSEDLVEVLELAGRMPEDQRVDLELIDESGASIRKDDVRMTEDNRRSVWELNNRSEVKAEVRRVSRKHGRGAKEHLWLVEPLPVADGSPGLSAEQVFEDLDQLEWLIESTHSYAHLRGIDIAAALDTIRAEAKQGMSTNALALALHRFIGSLGDGHARVDESLDRVLGGQYAPFLLGDVEEGLVAFRPDRSGFLDDERPYVRKIDGRPVDRWIEAGASLGRRGSAQFERRHGLRAIRHLDYCRRVLGLPLKDTVKVELAAASGRRSRTLELPVSSRRPIFGEWPKETSRRLEGEIGYLRIPQMDGDLAVELLSKLEEYRDARGLVIDVRGNGGGTRDILRALYPCLLPEKAGPRVVNVGALRLAPGLPRDANEGYLGDRYLFPATASIWSDEEKESIRRFTQSFEPGWQLPKGEFSDWHYFVVSPATARIRYERPVVVLMDTGCFSATDIFLGAFAELEQVTLIGTPSGGGSGRSRTSALANSGLRVRLSSMASFRPSGATYDGNGIEPDIIIWPDAGFFIGQSDPALTKAIDVLGGS
ncbi:MAG: S41 family peptidase [Planctomycetota bacterium]